MIVDRPFLLTIRDRASGALLFFGRISDPTAAAK
jgi:serpin B